MIKFHLTNWLYLQKPEFCNLGETRFWLLQVNNCSIPRSGVWSEIKKIAGDRCACAVLHYWPLASALQHNWRSLSSRQGTTVTPLNTARTFAGESVAFEGGAKWELLKSLHSFTFEVYWPYTKLTKLTLNTYVLKAYPSTPPIDLKSLNSSNLVCLNTLGKCVEGGKVRAVFISTCFKQ